MTRPIDTAARFLRKHALGLFGLVVAVLLLVFVKQWAGLARAAPLPRKAMQFTVVTVQPQPPKPAPPPPIAPPKIVEQPQATRVELKASEIPPPDAPARPAPAPAAGPAGPLALATQAEGPGDALGLVGNPGGRGLLGGGGLGDDAGGQLGGGTGNRYAWYYGRVASELEAAFRRQRKLASASTRVELRVWTEPSGRVARVQLVHSTGDEEWDRAIESVVGVRLPEPPPSDIPMPMILRLTARRLQ
jgi:TonB family protein